MHRVAWGFGGLALATLAAVATGGCATGGVQGIGPGTGPIMIADQPDALIQMRRSGCAGATCPVYSVSIFTDGAVVYEGRANVTTMGERRGTLSGEGMNLIITAMETMDFLDSPERCCTCPDTQHPELVVIDYRPGNAQKTVVHDQRCQSAPAAMSALERAIDRLTGAGQWGSPGADHAVAMTNQPRH